MENILSGKEYQHSKSSELVLFVLSGRAIVIPLAIEFRVNLMIYFGS
jgi:hypothetical protein